MRPAVLRIEGLPEGALDAAAEFHAEWLEKVRAAMADVDVLALVFQPAPYDHRGWRLSAVQDLAREAAPKRANAIIGSDEASIVRAAEWLAQAPGITGQLLAVDE
jgi:hypothetical protein